MAEVGINNDMCFVKVNQNVIIEMPSGNSKIVNIKPNVVISLGKFGNFNSDSLIGKPYGFPYEIIDKGNIKMVVKASKNNVLEETNANNQLIFDDTSVQSLSYQEVLELKEKGLQGDLAPEEIIKTMVDSHSEFSKKTEFSKAKYIERKKKKFTKVFTPIEPTINSVTDYFFRKNPDKIKHLRVDTLSQLLCLANVRANSKLLLVDDTQGLIVSSCLERMGGLGTLVTIHEGDYHNYDVFHYMNFPKNIYNMLYTVPLAMVDPSAPEEHFAVLSEEAFESKDLDSQRTYKRRKAAWEYKVKSRQLLHEGDFDGLIISSSFDSQSILEILTKYVCGSRPIIIYSFSKEQLLPAANYMRRSSDYINSTLTESSLREYQVLPGRMHPKMNMSGGGGYLLSAIRVIDFPFDPSLAKKGGNESHKKKKEIM